MASEAGQAGPGDVWKGVDLQLRRLVKAFRQRKSPEKQDQPLRKHMTSENARHVFDQYWLHARHQEWQRMTFAQVYLAVAGVSLALMKALSDDVHAAAATATQAAASPSAVVALYALLAVFSLLGLLTTHRWNDAFMFFSREAETMGVVELGMRPPYTRFYRGEKYRRRRIRLIWSVHTYFIALYSSLALLFTLLAATSACPNLDDRLVATASLIGAVVFWAFYAGRLMPTLQGRDEEHCRLLDEFLERQESART
jgi:hypothetical protein